MLLLRMTAMLDKLEEMICRLVTKLTEMIS